ncbi:hypothetical protein CRYUN_Cryun34aG0017600 [Craigia yunnanensis]
MGSSRCLLFFYSLLLSLATLTRSLDPFLEPKCNENRGNYTANSTYQANLNRIISKGDIDQNRCNSCLHDTATELERLCPSNKEATAWSEVCMVRYSNRDMYGLLENDPRTCVYNTANVSNPDQFNLTLSKLLNTLSNEAATGGPLRKYAAGNSETVYAMVQCTPDMDEKNCTACLNFAMKELGSCCYGSMGCRVLRPTCVLRFESNPFYSQIAVPLPLPLPPLPWPPSPSPTTSSPTSSGGNGNNTIPTVITVIASIVGVLILLSSPYAFL